MELHPGGASQSVLRACVAVHQFGRAFIGFVPVGFLPAVKGRLIADEVQRSNDIIGRIKYWRRCVDGIPLHDIGFSGSDGSRILEVQRQLAIVVEA